MRQADLHARSRAYQAFVFDLDGVVTDTAVASSASSIARGLQPSIDDFAVDDVNRTVTCPAGVTRSVSGQGRATFGTACGGCSLRGGAPPASPEESTGSAHTTRCSGKPAERHETQSGATNIGDIGRWSNAPSPGWPVATARFAIAAWPKTTTGCTPHRRTQPAQAHRARTHPQRRRLGAGLTPRPPSPRAHHPDQPVTHATPQRFTTATPITSGHKRRRQPIQASRNTIVQDTRSKSSVGYLDRPGRPIVRIGGFRWLPGEPDSAVSRTRYDGLDI